MPKEPTVDEWMAATTIPLKAELEALRRILLSIDGVGERIKWKAPSFFRDGVDIATFMVRRPEELLLIVHHPEVMRVDSPMLEDVPGGGRRIAHFRTMDEVEAGESELRWIVGELLASN